MGRPGGIDIIEAWNSFAPRLRAQWSTMTEREKQKAFFHNSAVVWDIDYVWVMRFVRLLELDSGQE